MTTPAICHTHQVEVPDRPILFDVRDYATVQAAFDAAYGVGPVYLPGFVVTDTINYRGQSIQGSSMRDSGLIGKPGQDVLHLDPTTTTEQVSSMHWRDFTIRVDDSLEGPFPDRGGVGNAGFACDYPDASDPSQQPLLMRMVDISNVTIESLSLVLGGNGNKSCGIYTQTQAFNLSRFRNVFFYRLDYGFWDDYPTSGLTAYDHARDHNHFDSLYFNGNGRGWRMVNHQSAKITNLAMHHNTVGLELKGVTSIARAGNDHVEMDTASIEYSVTPYLDDPSTTACTFRNVTIHASAPTVSPITFAFNRSKVEGLTCLIQQVNLTGHNNVWSGVELAYTDSLVDTGSGNRVELVYHSSAERPGTSQAVTSDSRIQGDRDTLPLLLGHVNPMPRNLADLLFNPANLWPQGYTEGNQYNRVTDSADFGKALRIQNAGGNWYTETVGLTGSTWPLTKLRVYVKAKLATSGTQVWAVSSGGTSVGSKMLAFTNAYTVQSFDIDLSGRPAGETILIQGNGIGSGAAPLDIAWIGVRPWAADGLVSGAIEAAGIILKSPDGTRYIAKIANGGTWTIAPA